MVIAIVIISLVVVVTGGVFAYKVRLMRKENKKLGADKKSKKKKEENDEVLTRNAFIDIVQKFMLRKEYKVLRVVNNILPPGFIAFPKIGLDTILEPIGSTIFFEKIKGKYVDLVIFEENTLKPIIAVDIYDNSPGDFPLETEEPNMIKAFKMANMPFVSIKVKADYTEEDIKKPIYNIIFPQGSSKYDKNVLE